MMFKKYWRKLIEQMIGDTPGLGNSADADQALRRSTVAVNDSNRVHDAVAANSDYLSKVARDNHYRDRITEAFLIRRTPS